MQVDAAQARGIQDRTWQKQAVGANDREVAAESGEFGLRLGVLQCRRRPHRQPQPLGRLVHGRAAELLATAAGSRRLGVDGRDVVAGGEQGVEARQDEAGRAHHDQAQALRHAAAGS